MFTQKSVSSLPAILIIVALLLPLPALADGKWLSFGEYETPEGTPPIIKVLEDDSYHTTLEVTIPGMWVEEVNEGGYTFQKLELPDFATLGEIGKPAIPAIGQFVGFLEPSTNSIEYKDQDKVVLEDMLIYPEQKPIFDDEDYGFEFDQQFYSQDTWYPKDRATVSETSIMREVCVAHTGIVPFEYNPAKRELIVHPQMLVTVYHKPGAEGFGDWTMPIGADPDFVEMYRGVIVNYDSLGMAEVDTSTGYDYLIITRDEFNDEAQDLADLLTNSGSYDVQVNSYDYFLVSGEVEEIIYDFYQLNRNDYVLLFGDETYIEPDYVVDPAPADYDYGGYCIPSDIAYVCFNPGPSPIPLPSLAIGRICVGEWGSNYAEIWVEKIADHYDIWQPGLMLKCLQVAHKSPREPFVTTKMQISNEVYPLYHPTFTPQYGNDPAVTNATVIQAIEERYQVVNYFGHSQPEYWSDWDLSGQNFGDYQISQIIYGQPSPFRPVVFDVTCWTGRFMPHPDKGDVLCQAESWMDYPGGAEGVIAATKPTYTMTCETFDKWLFKVLYGYTVGASVYGGEGHLGKLMNWAGVANMSTYAFGSTGWKYAVHDFYSYLVFGDPSLYILPIYSEFGNGNEGPKINKNNLSITNPEIPNVSLYPNPVNDNINISIANSVSGEMTIKLYDLSGRLVLEDNYSIDDGDNNIVVNLSNLGLNSGIYLAKIEIPGLSRVCKLVYAPESR